MQAILARAMPPARAALLLQFLRFGTVGFCGFVVTTAVVYATRGFLGNYLAIVPAFVIAATGNWMLNRLWTFRGQGSQSAFREWTMFLAANLLGFGLNAGTYWVLVALSAFCAANPVVPLLAGTLVGMFANFGMARQVVFR